jgi:hypothetical protein
VVQVYGQTAPIAAIGLALTQIHRQLTHWMLPPNSRIPRELLRRLRTPIQCGSNWNGNCIPHREALTMSKAAPYFEAIAEDQWNPVMARVTRTYAGAHARLEVMGPDVGYEVELEDRPFEGIAADVKDRERIVWMYFGDFSHAVHRASIVRMVAKVGETGPVIEIEDEDGVKTLLTLGNPAEFALPPEEKKERSKRG